MILLFSSVNLCRLSTIVKNVYFVGMVTFVNLSLSGSLISVMLLNLTLVMLGWAVNTGVYISTIKLIHIFSFGDFSRNALGYLLYALRARWYEIMVEQFVEVNTKTL